MPRVVALAAGVAALPLVAGCLGSPAPFHPQTLRSDPAVEHVLAQLEQALNRRDAGAICALYASPSPRCRAVWRARLRTSPRPVHLTLATITIGCAGDARVTYVESAAGTRSRRTLTVVNSVSSRYTRIANVGVGRRPSSLVVPASGSCADEHGWAGSDNRDPASARRRQQRPLAARTRRRRSHLLRALHGGGAGGDGRARCRHRRAAVGLSRPRRI